MEKNEEKGPILSEISVFKTYKLVFLKRRKSSPKIGRNISAIQGSQNSPNVKILLKQSNLDRFWKFLVLNNLEFCQLSNAITIKKICGSRKYDDREQRLHILVSGNEIRTGRIVSWFIIIIAKVTWFKSCKYMVNIMIQIII